VLGSAQEKNNYPIVYCSDGFCELTGFSRSELMRRSCACNFLYGLETNQEDINSIQKALKAQVELKKELMFYKKNGSPFWCLLDIVPIKNEKGNVVLFLASHKDITKRKISGEFSEQDVGKQIDSAVGSNQKLSRSRSRKFSRDVLLHLSRQYQQSTSPANKSNPRRPVKRTRSFSFNSERLPQYKRESDKKSKFLFLHYSNTKGFWDWWILILTTYIAIMVPYNVAFRRNDRKRDLIIFDMFIELFFIMDIVVHFRTSFVDVSGRIIYDQKKIAVHYLKGWFILDFLAALPFEALYFINQSWGFLIQLLKCGRLLRLFRVVRKLHRYTEYSTVLLTLLMIAFAMMAHWLACIWYVIGLSEITDKSTVSWLYALGEAINKPYGNFTAGYGPDEGSAYVTALYFTLTSMTTVGFGNVAANTNSEKVFAVVTMLIGALMHAAIFGNVAAIIQKLYANRVRYHSRANEIKQFIRVHRIEQDLANRLEDYFHTAWSLSGGVDTSEILTTFPDELQADVCMHLYKGLLELNPFSQAPRGCLRMLSPQVRTVFIGPGEVLLSQNDVINAIYYIANGSMEVLQGESVAAILGKGDLFGEDISRKIPAKRSNGDVRALTYCDVYFITRERLQNVLHFYQDFAFKFSDNLELTYDLGASERDIWRRGGLDSISENEEEEDEETEINVVDGCSNHVNHALQSDHCYGNSTRFNRRPGQTLNMFRKPNHFKISESWRGFKNNSAPDWKTQVNHTEKQLLSMLPSEEETDSAPQSPKSLTRQLAVDVNTESGLVSSPEEKSLSEPLSDPSLEWDQENLALKDGTNSTQDENGGEYLEMKNLNGEIEVTVLEEIEEEGDHDEYDKLLTEHTAWENGSIDSDSPSSDPPALTKKCSRDFSKHLYLACDRDDVDNLVPYSTGNLDDIPEIGMHHSVEINDNDDVPRKFYEDVDDSLNRIGFTDFDTMVNSPRRSPFVSSPTPSSLHKSPVQSISTSPIESTRGSVRSGFSELPFREGFSDSLRLSGHNSPYGSPKAIPTGKRNFVDNQDNSSESSKNSSRITLHKTSDSPRNKLKGIFSELKTPFSSGGSLKDGHSSRERLSRKVPLRRTFTEFNFPDGSCSSLNEKPLASPRRRKLSGAIQPPTIFAPLVTNVNNPYKDFVPPVRESAITCDCESAGNIPGTNCNDCLERKSDDVDSDNTEEKSEDQNEDFYKNVESVIAENKLQCFNNGESDHPFEESEEHSSKLTLTSKHSFENKELLSNPSQKIDGSSIDCSSVKELTNYFDPPFASYSSLYRRPSLSGAYSTHGIEKEEIPESDELGQLFRPMRTSFSEPHLSLRRPVLPGSNGSTEHVLSRDEVVNGVLSEDTTTRDLEDIFKDVCSTREAIEKLESILKSPEPDILTELADTKQTVQKLDKQVLKLNKEVASLSTDVKTVLELLKGLKNGQVVV